MASSTFGSHLKSVGFPDYSNEIASGTVSAGTSKSDWYTATQNCWLLATVYGNAIYGGEVCVNGITVGLVYVAGGGNVSPISLTTMIPLKSGDQVSGISAVYNGVYKILGIA